MLQARTRRSLFLATALVLLNAACSSPPEVLQGYVEADYIDLSSALGGTLETLSVSRGENVPAGKTVFVLEHQEQQHAVTEAEGRLRQAKAKLEDLKKGVRPSEIAALEARSEQVQAQYTFAREELRRSEELSKKRTISTEEHDRARAVAGEREHQLQEANAQLATAQLGARVDQISAQEAEVQALHSALEKTRWALAQKRVTSPEPAEVADTFFEPGEFVPGARPVVRLLVPQRVKYRFFIPEPLAAAVAPGRSIEVRADNAPPVRARVTFISPQAEFTPPVIFSRERREKLVFMVEARPEESSQIPLRPGQPIEVALK